MTGSRAALDPRPVYPDKEACGVAGCTGSVAWDANSCSVCLTAVDPPNIRRARCERPYLDQRYVEALTTLTAIGAKDVGLAFEAAAAASKAIFATPLDYALMLSDEKRFHQNYHQGVEGSARLPAGPVNDAIRLSVDAVLFGSTARKMSMAALSLEPLGLPSYGEVFMQFSEMMCSKRASVLCENSFDFVDRYPGGPDALPPGYRSTWQDRGRLALVTALPDLTAATKADDFARILLAAGPTRRDDRFMEVHIYESWNIESVVGMKIRATTLTTTLKQSQAEALGDRLRARGISWEVVA